MQDKRNSRRPERKTDRSSASKRTIFRRTVFLMAVITPLMFGALMWKLWDVSIVHHDEYQQRATKQQTMELSVSAERGVIYDRNGNVLSMSATVYDLIVSPRDLLESIPASEYTDKETEKVDEAKKEAAIAAQQVVCESNGNWQLAVTLWAGNKQGMRQLVVVDTATQPLNNNILPYYILEKHPHQ